MKSNLKRKLLLIIIWHLIKGANLQSSMSSLSLIETVLLVHLGSVFNFHLILERTESEKHGEPRNQVLGEGYVQPYNCYKQSACATGLDENTVACSILPGSRNFRKGGAT